MRNQGITLIALVVTVIVLLIISAVAISMITGNDGLFSKANEAGTLYNEKAEKEAQELNKLMDSEYFTNISAGSTQNPPINTMPVANGSFDNAKKVNTPDVSKLPQQTTKFITYTENSGIYTPSVSTTIPTDWYDYTNGKWANIKTSSTDGNLEAYWVWVPRFAYRLPENGRVAKEIEVIFVKENSKIGVLSNGTEVQCYYATDAEITTNGTGLYKDATALAKGTEEGKEQAWIIHPGFTFGNKQLNGLWFAKFEPSSSTPTAANGGDNVTNLKVQIKPNVTSWRNIQAANSFKVTQDISKIGGALGVLTESSLIDTHISKNMEWAAVSVLSQSKYGIFNSLSKVGTINNGGDGTLRVWNNPNSSFITGMVGTNPDASDVNSNSCFNYNSESGVKASTTGTIYGVYDMAGGSWEHTMGVMQNSTTTQNVPMTVSTGFNTWPDSKYYEIYMYNGDSNNGYYEYTRGRVGDLTSELKPEFINNVDHLWNDDCACFVTSDYSLFMRGGNYQNGVRAGSTAFGRNNGNSRTDITFRPILVTLD